MNGILLIDKEKDWTSNDVVVYLKKSLSINKVGHLGTLDPIATGVLPITLGKATRLFDLFLDKFKTYIAEFEFGYSTNTLDSTGEKTETNSKIPDLTEILDILPVFVGKIQQIPPQFSAKKVCGKRAYEYAREGKTIELKPRTVIIRKCKCITYNNNILTLEIECSAGTYVRAIGRDIAQKIGTKCTMVSLKRTKVGNFDIKSCVQVRDVNKQNVDKLFISCEDALINFDKLILDDCLITKLLNGCTIFVDYKNDGYYKVYKNEGFIGLAKVEKNTAKMYLTLI